MKTLLVVLSLVALAGAAGAKADNIQTLGPFTGNNYYPDPGPYQPAAVIGTFDILAGDTSIDLSGTFGNGYTANLSSSAGADVYLGDVLVASCLEFSYCYENLSGVPTPWSDDLTAAEIASLGTGLVDFTVVQTSQYRVLLGETTLDQAPGTAVTPEPGSLMLLGTGLLGAALLGFGGVTRRRVMA